MIEIRRKHQEPKQLKIPDIFCKTYILTQGEAQFIFIKNDI